ncbi:Hemin ABC superfamily ATP binding cassette transporter HmuV [Vibrio nigripulchritudo SFn27]|uniref:Hemin import ATP-binding protein hmuV n=1 Tax=Vibrio nigripulchritudo TaxID=28173 RepID=A0A9P1JLI1_9VIBR|nr:ABC transporter ATP-binding protein [Vibrio nigripulchritudo]CBJ93175.1 Putative Hemin import ATP-binding protein hmuV [Vibrio nigripulchritudo]CCN38696.1 Hemin ABC superfamily ATP binding cassette transporter HmuV [Vibrio nigripulchritudo AM115]CCN45005.1 Hemin ABC superfamily ATP binding cassette transporter HmuV [Vibrio nigripulchritudo FTn2]CCN79763.1 Hemin ABC superfamily ATP binding cassette transporter HmuV [Vibrio nigripulchritudo SO65]CCN91986.1 Hemin ABC superfamily ATP binding ca
MTSLRLKNISIIRGDNHTARNLSIEFRKGKVHAILGPNGVGKSSLLKAIFGEIGLQSGQIEYGNEQMNKLSLREWRKPFGYMPQDTLIPASLTVLEVVLLGQLNALSMHLSEDMLQRALEAMDKVGCLHLAQRDIQSLSGGQRQLVLFAQVILGSPEILMLDEPVSALDMHHQSVLLEHVHQETKKSELITVMVIHDLSLAAQYADELILLKDGEIKAFGSPMSVLEPSIISDIYNVGIERLFDSDGVPVIQPKRMSKSQQPSSY